MYPGHRHPNMVDGRVVTSEPDLSQYLIDFSCPTFLRLGSFNFGS
jgi:hypothetical protein